MTLRMEAHAFLIWRVAAPLGWSVTIPDVARELGIDRSLVRRVAERKGWLARFQDGRYDNERNPGYETVAPVDQEIVA